VKSYIVLLVKLIRFAALANKARLARMVRPEILEKMALRAMVLVNQDLLDRMQNFMIVFYLFLHNAHV